MWEKANIFFSSRNNLIYRKINGTLNKDDNQNVPTIFKSDNYKFTVPTE